ncbi:hypothetical protein K502DRAFT_310092 [Neoconidiobolus thromboides FSU 785]|nr:hypothetical protein K502DRAFT_310092 [Neoconidiobolus thromboides FSU 785]
MYNDYEDDDIPLELVLTPNLYPSNLEEEEYEHSHSIESVNSAVNGLPEEIKKFIFKFHHALVENNYYELQYIYENLFNKLTERYYAKSSWPDPEVVSHLVSDDQVFLTLYRELYYRHIYSKLQPSIEHRFQSYENYCDLFNYILNSDGPVPLELPNQWLWDIIDEFIYQFQTFSTFRNKIKSKTEEELILLKENPQVWSCYSVLNVLYSLIQKSSIYEHLEALKNGEEPGLQLEVEEKEDYINKPLYKMLGYFSIIGLLRVHCLLGNYTMALKTLDNVDLSKKSPFHRVIACHVTVYYYIGFCYMMMRRYADAIRSFSHILSFMARTKIFQTKSYQFDQMNKKVDQMYALLAMCISLFSSRVDEHIHNTLKEKYSEQMSSMRTLESNLSTYEELYLYSCPKFISPTLTKMDESEQKQSATQYQLSIFLQEVKHQYLIPTLRSYLALYSTLSIEKLASFLNIDKDEVRRQLLILKLKSKQKKQLNVGNLLDGQYTLASDLDFTVNKDIIMVTEHKIARRYGDWYIRNISKFEDMIDSLKIRKN